MGIFLIILILLFLLWPLITRWTQRYMARKAEDFLRNATGMPPRPGSRKAKKQAARETRENVRNSSYNRMHRSRRQSYPSPNEPIIPREYAEDVEFVETKDFSSTTIDNSGKHISEYHESQVSDAEWEEIKK